MRGGLNAAPPLRTGVGRMAKLTESQMALMTILRGTALIVQPKHEQDFAFIQDAKAMAPQGLLRVGYDKSRNLYAIKITAAGRAALEDTDHG